ncbi:unnamed protein product [Discula destructiva]
MKRSILLAIPALAWQVTARFLPSSLDIWGVDPARPAQTQDPGLPDYYMDNFLSAAPPMTTTPPSQAAVELRLRQDSSSGSSSSNTWLDSSTCGWYSGISSRAFQCVSPLACATNTDNVVACTTAGVEHYYTICMNYEAVQSSKCTSAGPKTACCTDASAPACGTFQWAATAPTRSMFRCFAEPTLIAMLDEPQFVLDASISSASVARSSSAAAAASRSAASAASASSASAASAAAASRASEIGGSSVTITTTTGDGSLTTFTAVAGATGSASGVTFISSVLYTTTGSDGASTTYTAIGQQQASTGADGSDGSNGSNGASGSGGTSTGAIAGGVIGGILGLLLLLLLMWYLMKKKPSPFKFSFKLCGGTKKVKKGDKHVNKFAFTEKRKDNREYNGRREYDNREYDNRRHSSGSGTRDQGGFSLFGGGAKSKSKKDGPSTTNTNNYYYGDEVRSDNRSYDKRNHTDKRAYEDNRKYNRNSDSDSHHSVTPPSQGFHFENNDRRSRPSFDSRDDTIVGIGGLGSRASSRREQRKQHGGRSSQTRNYYPPASRSPSPVQANSMHDDNAAVGGAGTSRRDKRRQERRLARGETSPAPRTEPKMEEHSEDEGEDVHRAAGQWQLQSPPPPPPQQLVGTTDGAPQNVHVHVHIHDSERERGGSRRGRSRLSQEHSRASSRRAPPPHYDDEDDDEVEEEERWRRQQQHEEEVARGRQDSRTHHRYHPGSGRRNLPLGAATPSPSPPPSLAPLPDDFIAKAL